MTRRDQAHVACRALAVGFPHISGGILPGIWREADVSLAWLEDRGLGDRKTGAPRPTMESDVRAKKVNPFHDYEPTAHQIVNDPTHGAGIELALFERRL